MVHERLQPSGRSASSLAHGPIPQPSQDPAGIGCGSGLVLGLHLGSGECAPCLRPGPFLTWQFEAESKRIIPESLNFVAAAIAALLPHRKDASITDAYPDIQAPNTSLFIPSTSTAAPAEPVDMARCLAMNETAAQAVSEQCKVDLLAVTLHLVQTYATMYANHDAIIELLQPILALLESRRTAKLSQPLKVGFD